MKKVLCVLAAIAIVAVFSTSCNKKCTCKVNGITATYDLKKIKDMDKRRKTSYEYVTGRKWADRHNYDRMICTSSLGLDKCIEEIVCLLSEKN